MSSEAVCLGRVGCYSLLSNNYEHLCEWCLHGEHRSYHVDNLPIEKAHWDLGADL